jgi:hypothetical protein
VTVHLMSYSTQMSMYKGIYSGHLEKRDFSRMGIPFFLL